MGKKILKGEYLQNANKAAQDMLDNGFSEQQISDFTRDYVERFGVEEEEKKNNSSNLESSNTSSPSPEPEPVKNNLPTATEVAMQSVTNAPKQRPVVKPIENDLPTASEVAVQSIKIAGRKLYEDKQDVVLRYPIHKAEQEAFDAYKSTALIPESVKKGIGDDQAKKIISSYIKGVTDPSLEVSPGKAEEILFKLTKKQRDEAIGTMPTKEILTYNYIGNIVAGNDHLNSRLGKVAKYISDIKNGDQLSPEDYQYFQKAAPTAWAEITQNGQIPAENLPEYYADINSFEKVKKNNLISQTAIDLSSKIGFDTERYNDNAYLSQIQNSFKEQQELMIKELDKKYQVTKESYGPLKVGGGGSGYRNEKVGPHKYSTEYNEEKREIENEYANYRDIIATASTQLWASENPNATAVEIGKHYLSIMDPDKLKLFELSGGERKTEGEIAEQGYRFMYATANPQVVKKAQQAEKQHADKYPDEKITEIYHRIGSELFKKNDNILIHAAPTVEDMDQIANTQLSSKDREIYLKHIRPAEESRLFGTNVPRSGFLNKAMEAFETSIEETWKGGQDLFGVRGTQEQAKEGLAGIPTGKQDVGEYERGKARLEELKNKPNLTFDEIQERRDLERFVDVRNYWAKGSDLIGNTTGQVVEMALGGKGIGMLGKAAALAKTAKAVNTAEKIGMGFMSHAMSYDQARRDLLQLKPQATEAELTIYGNIIGFANAFSEQIFHDPKVLQAFAREVSPAAQRIFENLSKDGIQSLTSSQFRSKMENFIKRDLVKFAKEYGKNVGQEVIEEEVVQVATSILDGVIRPDKFSAKAEWDKVVATAAQTAIGMTLIGGVGAIRDVRANRVTTQLMNRVGYDNQLAQEVKNVINSEHALGNISDKEKNEKLKVVNTLESIHATTIKAANEIRPLSKVENEKIAMLTLQERMLNEKIDQLPYGDTKDILQKQVNDLKAKRNQIIQKEVVVDDDYNLITVDEWNRNNITQAGDIAGGVINNYLQNKKDPATESKIVTDYDGTVVNSKGEFTKFGMELKNRIASGEIGPDDVKIITARHEKDAQMIADKLGIDVNNITAVGGTDIEKAEGVPAAKKAAYERLARYSNLSPLIDNDKANVDATGGILYQDERAADLSRTPGATTTYNGINYFVGVDGTIHKKHGDNGEFLLIPLDMREELINKANWELPKNTQQGTPENISKPIELNVDVDQQPVVIPKRNNDFVNKFFTDEEKAQYNQLDPDSDEAKAMVLAKRKVVIAGDWTTEDAVKDGDKVSNQPPSGSAPIQADKPKTSNDYADYLLDLIEGKQNELGWKDVDQLRAGLVDEFIKTTGERDESRAIANLESLYVQYLPKEERVGAYQTIRENFKNKKNPDIKSKKDDIERRRKEDLEVTKKVGEDKLKEGRENTKNIVESLKKRYDATSVQGIVIRILEKLIDFNKYSTIVDSEYINSRNASGQATWFGMIISQETLDGILLGKEHEVHTYIHEFIHGFTTSKISGYNIEKRNLIPGYKSNLTAKEKNAIEQLQRIFEKVKADNPKSKEYGFTNLDEFVAEAFSNLGFQYTLKNTKSEGKKSSLFSEFINAIGDILFEQLERWAKRFNKEIPQRDTITGILEDVLSWAEDLIDQNNKLSYIATNEEINAKYDAEILNLEKNNATPESKNQQQEGNKPSGDGQHQGTVQGQQKPQQEGVGQQGQAQKPTANNSNSGSGSKKEEVEDYVKNNGTYTTSDGMVHPIVKVGDTVRYEGELYEVTTSNEPDRWPNDYLKDSNVPHFRGKQVGGDDKILHTNRLDMFEKLNAKIAEKWAEENGIDLKQYEEYGLHPIDEYETTYRGASNEEWESIKNGGESGLFFTPSKSLAEVAGAWNEADVVIEFKPEAKEKLIKGEEKFDSLEYYGKNRKGLKLEDVQRVTDKKGNILYDAENEQVAPNPDQPVQPEGKGNIATTPSSEIISQLSKIPTVEGKLNWLRDNGYLQPIVLDGKEYNAVDYNDRVIALIKIGGINIPFYISTGQAGKKNVKAGNWYAIFGIGESGWINKGTEELINSQYDSPVLQKIAKILNEGIGTIQSRDNNGNGKLYDFIGFMNDSEHIDQFNPQMRLPIIPAKTSRDSQVFWDNAKKVLEIINDELRILSPKADQPVQPEGKGKGEGEETPGKPVSKSPDQAGDVPIAVDGIGYVRTNSEIFSTKKEAEKYLAETPIDEPDERLSKSIRDLHEKGYASDSSKEPLREVMRHFFNNGEMAFKPIADYLTKLVDDRSPEFIEVLKGVYLGESLDYDNLDNKKTINSYEPAAVKPAEPETENAKTTSKTKKVRTSSSRKSNPDDEGEKIKSPLQQVREIDFTATRNVEALVWQLMLGIKYSRGVLYQIFGSGGKANKKEARENRGGKDKRFYGKKITEEISLRAAFMNPKKGQKAFQSVDQIAHYINENLNSELRGQLRDEVIPYGLEEVTEAVINAILEGESPTQLAQLILDRHGKGNTQEEVEKEQRKWQDDRMPIGVDPITGEWLPGFEAEREKWERYEGYAIDDIAEMTDAEFEEMMKGQDEFRQWEIEYENRKVIIGNATKKLEDAQLTDEQVVNLSAKDQFRYSQIENRANEIKKLIDCLNG